MKLIIFDNGDPSVGIFGGEYEMTCPFEREDVDKDKLEFFRKNAISLYAEFDSATYAMYDFEVEETERGYLKSVEL
jgi:hypothetical protein